AFFYGDTYPNFGPRGVRLPEAPIATRAAPFVSRSVSTADVLSLTQDPIGVPYVGLFSNRGNGMFVRFGNRVRAGNPEDLAQRSPVDLYIGQFGTDGPPSGVIINRANGLVARHSLVLGNDLTNPPLRFFQSLPVRESGSRCKGGYLNSDAVEDLVVLGKYRSDETPALYMSDVQSNSGEFTRVLLSQTGAPYQFTALEIADLDQDGHSDIVFATAGMAPRVLIAYGDQNGSFQVANMIEPTFDLSAAGYVLHKDSTIVDVQTIGTDQKPALAFVISGVLGQPGSAPAVASLERGTQARAFAPLQSSNLLMFPGGTRLFAVSTAGDLTGNGSRELVVGAIDDDSEPLRVFTQENQKLQLVADAVDIGVEQVLSIKSVGYGLATVVDTHHQSTDRPAIFVTHEAQVASGIEHRVSTFFSVPGKVPALVPPSPARRIEETVLGVVVGRFRTRSALLPSGESSDAWAAVAGGLKILQNDGLGEISLSGQTIHEPMLVPSSLARVSAGHSTSNLEAPCVLTLDGRIGMVLPVDPTEIVWAGGGNPIDLRSSAPPHLRIRNVMPDSLIQSGDLDGDGVQDLVVLLSLSVVSGAGLEGESMILFMRGLPDPAQGVFPYELILPTSGMPNGVSHGNATALALGDFAIQTTSPNPLEIAVVVPNGSPGGIADGNHVRAYRYDTSTHEILRSSTDPLYKVWVSGVGPTRALAADYNGDGRTDLAVASRGDSMLRVLYNFSPQGGSGQVDVDLGAFQEAPANPIPFSGDPLKLLGGDLNGDRVPDVVLVTNSTTGSSRDQQVIFFLSPGKLSGVSSRGVVPPERTGNLVKSGTGWVLRNGAASLGLGDLNGDNAPDLLIGWQSLSKDDYNLRVLFGNSF
ncbi:MAG: VCBS repeat-containing protein, partial [Planctomycetota bacterium]|nr:VCBS repeat-containing protein [Planctomycetota bacterium]